MKDEFTEYLLSTSRGHGALVITRGCSCVRACVCVCEYGKKAKISNSDFIYFSSKVIFLLLLVRGGADGVGFVSVPCSLTASTVRVHGGALE